MTLIAITARFECDGCGKPIDLVHLDPATENVPSLFAAAEEALKDDLHTTIQHDMHLCAACTSIADNIHEDPDQDPTREEITEALEEEQRRRAAFLEGDSYQ